MTPSEYCKHWEAKYAKAVKVLHSIGFPLELIVCSVGVLSPIVIWMVANA